MAYIRISLLNDLGEIKINLNNVTFVSKYSLENLI